LKVRRETVWLDPEPETIVKYESTDVVECRISRIGSINSLSLAGV